MHRKTNFLVNLYWDNKHSDPDCVGHHKCDTSKTVHDGKLVVLNTVDLVGHISVKQVMLIPNTSSHDLLETTKRPAIEQCKNKNVNFIRVNLNFVQHYNYVNRVAVLSIVKRKP